MLTQNSYLDYKRSTTYLVYRLSHASNTIIRALSQEQQDDSAAKVNTTGQVSCKELITMTKRVAANLHEEVPSTIFRLFRSVIKARSKAYEMFRELAATHADEKMEESNISHKHFIDRLDEAFAILGGEAWMAKQRAGVEEVEDRETIERIIFTNPFSALTTELSADDSSDDADDQLLQSSRSRAKKTFGKGKRGQKRKKKTKSTPTTISEGIDLKDIPLESFRILDGPEDLITDYYIAITYAIDEWQKLRAFIHDQWYFVTHKDLNSAIAGTLSCLAIGMVRRTMATIFIEFPREQDTYESIMQTFTRGAFKKDFCTSMLSPDPDDKHVDVGEAISMYAYQDLHDFLLDYQKNRNGKPTKRMQAHLSDWDPKLDLSQVDKKTRIAWRRSFTINWLYDLVNVHSHNVRQSPYIKVEGVALEAIPWSSQHSSFAYDQLLGVEQFAGAITTLAMQKPGTNLVAKITMWLVFQLQCIVDATTISRGWSFMMSNQLLEPSCPNYSPRQDIDVFLGETTEIFEGFYWGARLSLINLEKDAVEFGNPARYSPARHGLDHLSTHIRTWLGASEHVLSWSGVPSRFAEHDSNGLWNYSPFLCGTGLMEALEITYRSTMITWDKISEPIGLLHLHNMASQKGYLTNQETIFNNLTTLFADSFFDQGIIPTRRFDQAWRHRTQNVRTRPLRMQRSEAARAARCGRDIHSFLSLDHNLYFRRRSNLLLYREADWDPERILESSMEPRTALGRSGSGSSSGNTSSTSSPIIESFGALSLGDCRIVEDDNELELDYSMAADSMFEEWKCLRAYVQDLWHQVAYRNLNSAIAATMSEIAIKMVKKTELNIFVDFPNGYDAFEKVMNKFAENEENAHEVSSANLQTDSTADSSDANAPDDIAKEMMSGHTYADFLDFFKDFQKNQNGRPSKKMAKRLKTWNSHLDLRVASDAERIEWRRLYTMKWLYDLVNVYAYTVLNSNLRPDNQKAYREQDWTDKIPHDDNKDLSRLFGCEEFACFVTTLAMSKPAYHGDTSSELSRRIDPHRVFQLQSIVDSFMVSRGWSLGPEGHIVSSIVSTVQFSSDLGRLLGIFTRGAEWLSRALMVPAFSSAPSCNQDAFDRIFAIMEAWMGNSERVFDSAAASQFAPSRNGLWDYSPFLCGAGLAEGLELVYRMSMLLWDEIPHPTLVIHLHNMCVKKGYLEQPRDLLQALENTFTAAFYKTSIVPDQDFHRQFPQLLATGRRESLQPGPVDQRTNLLGFLSLEHNTRFKKTVQLDVPPRKQIRP
ncbi:MAG: hypothetical protein AUREO_057680 [Aureobasidium pullulans]|nr:MAG: hypothetical protein AUREO_057680 [Aureobasidium pullulans]